MKKHKHSVPSSLGQLKERIDRARQEGRTQQALELVKQLHRAEPTPAHFEMLKEVYIERARQLCGQGSTRDAATALEVASGLDEKNQLWQERIAREMVQTGDVQRTVKILQRLPESVRAPLLAPLTDQLIAEPKMALPDALSSLRADREHILTAFRQVEAGQDEAARQTLQAIGLRSPLLEWKVLLRGLQAYYQHDDDRARDNWQRLDPTRLPARLAAPFRAAIDPAYRDAQKLPVREQLRQQMELLQGNDLIPALRSLQKALDNEDEVASAYRQAESLVPRLREQAPHLVPRLERILYWKVLHLGPDYIPRYRRIFGSPADDPQFNRLEAIARDANGDLAGAHEAWQRYEQDLVRDARAWPGEQARLARALIWLRMGQNAASIPSREQRKKLPRYLRRLPGMPEPLEPKAEKCFKKCIELAPELLEAHEELFAHLRQLDKPDKALRAGLRLLVRFPDHVATLVDVAKLHQQMNQHAQALELLQRALAHNPLDRQLRILTASAHMSLGRQRTERKDAEGARAQYEAALALTEPLMRRSIYTRWAAAELKFGDEAHSEALLAKARETSPGELVIRYTLLVEAHRLSLPLALKKQFTSAFHADVSEPSSPAEAVELVTLLAELHQMGIRYRGQKSHTKKILDLTDRIDKKAFAEEHWMRLLPALLLLEAPQRLLRRFLDSAQGHYPHNPFFPYFEAKYRMDSGPEGGDWHVADLLDKAEQLANERRGEANIASLLEEIKQRRRLLVAFNPFLGGMDALFDGMEDFDDFEDLDDFDA